MTLHHCQELLKSLRGANRHCEELLKSLRGANRHCEERSDAAASYLVLRGGKPVCCVSSLPGAAFTRPCVTGEVLAATEVLFLRRLLV